MQTLTLAIDVATTRVWLLFKYAVQFIYAMQLEAHGASASDFKGV